MPEPSLIDESLRLMLIGMGSVFAFLLLMVALLRAMSWIAGRLEPADAEAPMLAPGGAARAEPGTDELIAVIGAAINRYRSER